MLYGIGKAILKICGVLLIILGVFLFLGLTTSSLGIGFMNGNVDGKEWLDLILLNGKDFYLGIVGLFIFIGIPIVLMIYGGFKLLLKIKYSNRWLNLSAGIVWLFGFILVLYLT